MTTETRGRKPATGVARPPREELEALFINQRLTRGEIAEKYGVTDNAVKSWINGYKLRKGEQPPDRISREKLEEMYITQDLTMTQIAEATGISRNTINTWCQRYKLRKKPSDPKRISWLDEEGEAVSFPEKAPQVEPTQITEFPGILGVLDPRKPKRPRKPKFYPVETHRGKLPLATDRAKRLPPEQQAKIGRLLTLVKIRWAERSMIRGVTLTKEEDLL